MVQFLNIQETVYVLDKAIYDHIAPFWFVFQIVFLCFMSCRTWDEPLATVKRLVATGHLFDYVLSFRMFFCVLGFFGLGANHWEHHDVWRLPMVRPKSKKNIKDKNTSKRQNIIIILSTFCLLLCFFYVLGFFALGVNHGQPSYIMMIPMVRPKSRKP